MTNDPSHQRHCTDTSSWIFSRVSLSPAPLSLSLARYPKENTSWNLRMVNHRKLLCFWSQIHRRCCSSLQSTLESLPPTREPGGGPIFIPNVRRGTSISGYPAFHGTSRAAASSHTKGALSPPSSLSSCSGLMRGLTRAPSLPWRACLSM